MDSLSCANSYCTMKGIPVRVCAGIYEVSRYIRELLGDDDLSKIPERINLKGVKIEIGKVGLNFYSFPDDDNASFLKIFEKSNKGVYGVLFCGGCDKDFSLNMQIDLFHDVRRIEEYESDESNVIIAYLSNKDTRIYIVKGDKSADTSDGQPEPEPELDDEP